GIDVDFNQIMQAQTNDPTSGLRLLRGAETVTNVGPEQVRGTGTTHYALVVNIDKAAASAPASAQDAMRKLAALYTVKDFNVDVWLDGDGRVRRFQQTIDGSTIKL